MIESEKHARYTDRLKTIARIYQKYHVQRVSREHRATRSDERSISVSML